MTADTAEAGRMAGRATAPVASASSPTPDPSDRQRRRFLRVLPGVVVAFAVFAALLQPAWFGPDARATASAAGLVVSGGFLAVSCWVRVRQSAGRRRRSWALIMVGALVAMAGNIWAAAVGSDPVTSPSAVSNATITIALTLCIVAALGFAGIRRRGVDLFVMTLDGLVIGGAVLIIASTLVYDALLERTADSLAAHVAILLIPVLDVVLAVVVLLLLLLSRGPERPVLALLAAGYLAYVAADLPFAVLVAQRDFAFGTPLDLGWIGGYALLALAAWYPVSPSPTVSPEASTNVPDTVLVYAVLVVAAAVQVLFGSDGALHLPTMALWLVLALSAAGRQILLTVDNNALRRGLEDRVRAQTADLRRMARQTQVLVTSVRDGIYGVDTEGRITFVNPAGAAALRHSSTGVLGRNAHDLFHAPDDDGLPFDYEGCYIAQAIASGAVTFAEEDVYVRADGSTFDVEITASPILDDGVPQGAVIVFRDVTQRREVDRMKNEFLSVVSHELRTPLTSIRGSLELLDSGMLGELTPQARSMTSIAVESSERLTRLINDILDLERIESGTRSVDAVPIDAVDLLERSATEMSGLAESTGVEIVVGPSFGRAMADADRIVQTLTNLVSNAVKFSEPGQTVRLDAVEQEDQVLFRVCDQGRGIPADKLDTVFGRFEQVDSSDARQKGGTGLGLAISRGIVEHHGGRIWAESELGVGTTVLFTLPSARTSPRASHGRTATTPHPHPQHPHPEGTP